MEGRFRRILSYCGFATVSVGAVLILADGAIPASASTHHSAGKHSLASSSVVSSPTAPVCSGQPGLNDPTNTTNKVLTSYYFGVTHNGVTTNVCSIFGNVKSGDTVTAFFTMATGANQSTVITLVAYNATAGSTTQTLASCASFGVSTGSCVSTNAHALTVTLPVCGFQVDLIYGAPTSTNNLGAYHAAHTWITGQLGGLSGSCPGTPTTTTTTTTAASTTTTGGAGSGVAAANTSTPSTGAGGDAETVAGLALLAAGAGMVGAARWMRTNANIRRRRKALFGISRRWRA